MTQQGNEPTAADGPETDKLGRPDGSAGSDTDPQPDTFTIEGSGSDAAAPAVQPGSGAGVESHTRPAAQQPDLTTAGILGGAPTRAPSGDYDKYGVPTMDFVRDKIEARYAASLGAEELARQTEEAKSFEQRAEERAKAAEAALDAIRRSLREHRQS